VRFRSGEPIQFYSCFISYSTKDQDFVNHLYTDLQEKGVRCWFAPHDVKSGQKLHEQIDSAIKVYDRLLLILSPDSMASAWVTTEIRKARRRELQESRRMLFPVSLVDYEVLRSWECFDADTGTDAAHEIREYYIPIFKGWRNNFTYQAALEMLMRDLAVEGRSISHYSVKQEAERFSPYSVHRRQRRGPWV
jgi:TIR domain